MASFQHYEDLRAVFARMTAVLPGQNQTQVGCEDAGSWDWRNTVIEAKPIRLQRLAVPGDQVPFKGEIPSKHQTSTSRRWYVSEQTQAETGEWPASSPAMMPAGVSLWHASDQAKRLTILAMHDATELFRGQVQECTLPAHDEWRTSGRLTLFATPGPAELCFRDSARLLADRAPYLARLAREYARSIAWMYGLHAHEFELACRFHVAWHAPGSANPARLAPASPCRYENGPIVQVAVGRPVVTHDLVPVLQDASCVGREYPVRLEVSEGVMVCTDGPARMRYSHGYPSLAAVDGKHGNNWFTLTFFLDCTRQSLAMGYDRETRSLIMATPVRRDRVMAGSSPESVPSGGGLGLDLMGVLVKDMRLRLRAAESHVLASRHEADLKSRSSSSMSCEKSSRYEPSTMFLNSTSSSTNGSEGWLEPGQDSDVKSTGCVGTRLPM